MNAKQEGEFEMTVQRTRRGIDVSDNQKVIDWGKVKAAGVAFAVLRSVRGSGKTDYQFRNKSGWS